MPDFGIYAGDTNKTIYVRLRDSTTGLGKTGLVFNSAGAVCSYTLPLAARAAITLVTQTVTGAHTDGGFVEVDATNCKGLYRLDLTDASIASGAYTVISIEFDGIIEESILIPLHTREVDVVKWLGTAAAAVDTAGYPKVTIKDGTGAGEIALTAGKVDGVALVDAVTTLTGHTAQTGDNFARIGAAGASLTDLGGMSTGMKAEVNAEADTALTDYDAPTKTEMDTAHALLATEAKQDVIDTVVDAIKAVTDALPDSGALTTIGADTARLTAVRAAVLTDWINGGRLDLLLDAIPTTAMRGTDNVVLAGPTKAEMDTAHALLSTSTALATVDTVVDAIKVITDALGATAAANLAKSAGNAGIVSGSAAAGTLSTTQMSTDLSEATDDHYIGRAVIWTSGVLLGQASDITDYAGTNGVLTYTAVTEAPSAADTFILI